MFSNNFLFYFIFCFYLIKCSQSHSSPDSDRKSKNYTSKYSQEIKLLFNKYAKNVCSMNFLQFKTFSRHILSAYLQYDLTQTDSNCLNLKYLQFLNLTSHLNDQSIIDRTKFAKLSSYLISYIDICVNKLYNNDYSNNLNLTDSMCFKYNSEKSGSDESFATIIKRNFFQISKESKLLNKKYLILNYFN